MISDGKLNKFWSLFLKFFRSINMFRFTNITWYNTMNFFPFHKSNRKSRELKLHTDIKTAIFTLKHCCPTLLSREDNYFNMQYFKNIAHWKKTVKEQKTVLTAGEAAEIAQIRISDCWAHLCLCKFIWYLHYTSWLHCKLQWMCNSTLFSYISPS